jgi:competence protein ComEA
MNRFGDRWRELFTFSKRERPGVILLCVLLILTAALPRMFRGHAPAPDALQLIRADSFLSHHSGQQPTAAGDHAPMPRSPAAFPEIKPPSLSWFDPNALTFADWEKLGLQERTIRVILHYRQKGGMFRRPEDLSRIWGMPVQDYQRLKPYVRIATAEAGPLPDTRKASPAPVMHARSDTFFRKRTQPVDVNTADSLQWLALPGIGERLTSRILRFRERLGGFISVDQVGETYGLPDSTFQLIRPFLVLSATSLRRIPLNSAPETELQRHPYIRFRLARIIIQYRQEHGPFHSVDDLRQLALVTEDLFAKLAPYCSTN